MAPAPQHAILRNNKKRDHVDVVKEVVNDRYICRLASPDIFMDYDELIQSYWTTDRLAQIRAVIDETTLTSRRQNLSMELPVVVTHEVLDEPLTVTPTFVLTGPEDHQQSVIWPKVWTYGGAAFANPKLVEMAEGIVRAGVDRGLLREVTIWLLENCKTHEQAAFLLPGWRNILKRSQNFAVKGIGEKLHDGRPSGAMPTVPAHMRKKLRWAHVFLSTHEFIGTFDGDLYEGPYDPTKCTLRLNSGLTVWIDSQHSITIT